MTTKSLFVKLCLAASILFLAPTSASGQVTIGSSVPPNSFSVLELVSNQGGLRLPQLTTAERNALTGLDSPEANGLAIFNIETNCLEFWNGSQWVNTCGSAGNDVLTSTLLTPDADDQTICGGAPIANIVYSTVGATNAVFSGLPAGVVGAWNNSMVTISGTPTEDGEFDYTVFLIGENLTVSASGRITVLYNEMPTTPGCHVRAGAEFGCWLTFMCYNLGADPNMSIEQQMAYVSSGNTDHTVFGYLFQWGRTTDGHQVRTSPCLDGACGTSASSVISGAGLDAITGQPTTAVGQFIRNNAAPHDWRTPQANDLWTRNGRANDPCPAGWRVPTDAELQAIIGTSPVSINTNWQTRGQNDVRWIAATTGGTSGILVRPSGITEATLFLPVTGFRYRGSGAFSNVGATGYYWSSTVGGTTARRLGFSSNTVSVVNASKTNGISVRCVAE